MDLPYSSRLPRSTVPNALCRAVEQRRNAGQRILDLSQSNPTVAGIDYPPVYTALADSRSMQYDPVAVGSKSARQAVSDYYAGTVDPERILLTASTSEAYS